MPRTSPSRFLNAVALREALALAVLLLLMVASWVLVHGVTRGMYQQFAYLGDPQPALGPVGEAGQNQLGHYGYFWSERAFHYRTALMFAVDDYTDPDQLHLDRGQQYPEGVDSWREYTLLMEPVYGKLYRWFGRPDEILVDFLLRLIPLIFVLLAVPLYAAARALRVRPWLALLAVLVFFSCSLGFARLSGSLLLKENFALLWLMVFLALHFWALRQRSFLLVGLAAGSLFLLLASWHLSQFLALVMLGAAALFETGTTRRSGEEQQLWPVAVPLVYLVAGIGAGLTPSLWARQFLLGLPMMVLVAWAATALVARSDLQFTKSRFGSAGLFLLAAVLLGGLSLFNRHYAGGDYSHVFGLLWHKIVHGFQRPDDPGALPFAVRVFWAAPFNSPTWPEIWHKLGFHLVLLVPAVGLVSWLGLTRRLDPRQNSLLLMGWGFLLAWLLIERLGGVFWPLGVLLIAVAAEAGLETWSSGPKARRTGAWVVGIVGLLAVGANLQTVMKDRLALAADVTRGREIRLIPSDGVLAEFRTDLLQWITRNTPGPQCRFGVGQPQAFVGDIGVSPQILLYTGRPVVLNSQFENLKIRQRYRRYLEALFSADDRQLQDFLNDTQAGYLFIGRNWATVDSPGSAAYLAGVDTALSPGMNLARLQFNPESFSFMRPVYDNEYYRVFKVGGYDMDPATWDRGYGNWWDIRNFTVSNGRFTDLAGDRRKLQDFEDDLVALQDAQNAILVRLQAATGAGRANLPQLHQRLLDTKLARLSGARNPERLRAQEEQLIKGIQTLLQQPLPGGGGKAGQALATLFTRGTGEGHPGWEQLLATGHAEPTHLAAAAQLLGLLGQYDRAAITMLQAEDFFSDLPTLSGDGRVNPQAPPVAMRIRHAALGYLVASGQLATARDLARQWVMSAPAQSTTRNFFQQVAAIPAE